MTVKDFDKFNFFFLALGLFPIYYSLQNATTIACSPKSRKVSSTLYDLRELKNIADTYVQRVLNGDLHLESTVVCELLRTKKMDFFHSKIDGHSEILASTELPAYDSGFDSCLINLEGPMGFASTGTFIRGCVGYFNT
mgnify:CR=1 FL=1